MQDIYQNPFKHFYVRHHELQSYLWLSFMHTMLQQQYLFISIDDPSFPPTSQPAFATGTLLVSSTVI